LRKILSILLLVIAFYSCQKSQENTDETLVEKPNSSVEKSHRLKTKVRFSFKDSIADWETYRNLDDFIGRFDRVSSNEILSNALELEELVRKMKDTVKPRFLMSPAVYARINVLYNESLRLSDMILIPAITSEEVHDQTDKVLKAFSSLNAKINTVLRKKRFEESIDFNADFIGIDTTKIDSVSRKTIRERQLQKQDEL